MARRTPAFPEEQQLCEDLRIVNRTIVRQAVTSQNHALAATLPGQPTLLFTDNRLPQFLRRDLLTPDLDRMAPHLWLMATPSHTHISPLHHQIVRGREIVITENPELHLVWIGDRVFIKPVPLYLTSYPFWLGCLHERYISCISPDETAHLQQASLGFMRTWYYLIRHESDFRIAKQLNLIPEVSWARFITYITYFAQVADSEVSPRYHYGDLRLSRLNIWAKVFLRRWKFHKVHGQYGAYFAQFYGPVLFVFAIFSTMLSAMQVVLASGNVEVSFSQTSRWFSVATLLFAALICSFFVTMWAFMLFRETLFALRKRLGNASS